MEAREVPRVPRVAESGRAQIPVGADLAGNGAQVVPEIDGGRAAPENEHSNDLVHHQTRMIVADIESLARSLNSGRFVLISPGVISTPKAELAFRSGLLVRDPDGHPMELVEQ